MGFSVLIAVYRHVHHDDFDSLLTAAEFFV